MRDEIEGPALAGLRLAALISLVIGSVGSIGLWIHAARHPPVLLIVLFVIWVLSPFAGLGVAHQVSKRLAPGPQATLYIVTVFVALASLLIYGDDALNHSTTHPAFVYVMVPPAAWLFGVTALLIAALRARRV
jgi:hypothetical protein